MIWICSRLSVPLMRITASTASCANWSFSCVSSFELRAAEEREGDGGPTTKKEEG